MAGSLLNIYGNYENAANRYNNQYQNYINQINAYNTAGKNWEQAIKDYNASIVQDPYAYMNETGQVGEDYTGTGPTTSYNGHIIGRINPISTYQAQAILNQGTDEEGNPYSYTLYYDPKTGLGRNPENSPIGSSYSNENAYLDPSTGLVSIFAARPSATFDMTMPTAPTAPESPLGMPQNPSAGFGNVSPEELYQKQFGRSTPDVLSNEAWSLANIGTPFLSSQPENTYETGGVAAINNPLAYVGPDALTTGQTGVDQNAIIAGQQVGNTNY